MQRIVIIGAGFAGFWAAISAYVKKQEIAVAADLEIIIINKTKFHDIRVRNYEANLESTRYDLHDLLDPLGIKIIMGVVTNINTDKQEVIIYSDVEQCLSYDKLILASGSNIIYPDIPGLQQYAFNVDSYAAAEKLRQHLEGVNNTVIVVGGGFTGIELASELVHRTKAEIVLLDRGKIADSLGARPQEKIISALQDMQIKLMPNRGVIKVTADALYLASGEVIATKTVIWTGGMCANKLTEQFVADKDCLGRIKVNKYLQIPGVENCFAAGDVAAAKVDAEHYSMMSCQHGRPQGKVAGYNAVAAIYDLPLLDYKQEVYVTCLDLGSWGALFMRGWDRIIEKDGLEAKALKHHINYERICPPESLAEMLAEAKLI